MEKTDRTVPNILDNIPMLEDIVPSGSSTNSKTHVIINQ